MSTATAVRDIASQLQPQKVSTKEGIIWTRMFSPTEDPYETIEMEQTDILIKNFSTGAVVLQQDGVWYPVGWSQNARNIFAQHYLRGPLGTDERETSVLQSIDRVIDTQIEWAMHGRIIESEGRQIFLGQLFADEASAWAYATDLKYMIVSQELNYNSPVWYNIGVARVPQQCSACFILHVEDTIDSITNWYAEEATVFKGGSGAGLDISRIRSSFEGLSHGGKASGPGSYMRAADASAGTMASGGRSRRAAKMVTMLIDHPDIYEQAVTRPDGTPIEGFIRIKVRAEDIGRVLRDAGFDMDVSSGTDAIHLQYQNANLSVRVTNDFMEAVQSGGRWKTVPRRPDLVWKETPEYDAKFLWTEIARAAHACADPGLQFDTTINHWHSTPAAGRIDSSNPCSEYLHIDNSPCNLAATNLLKFLEDSGGFSVERYIGAVSMLTISQTILAVHGDYPTPRITQVARGFRQIGQGYTNNGAFLMAKGLPYDSDAARAWNASITSLMQATIFRTSTQLAEVWGVYAGVTGDDSDGDLPGFDNPENRRAHLGVANLHRHYHRAIAKPPTKEARKHSIKFGSRAHIDTFFLEVVGAGLPVKVDPQLRELWEAGTLMWDQAVERAHEHGLANAHMSVLAPMGTNGYMMDNDTTGIEPDFALSKNKKKVSGDHMLIVNQTIERAVLNLGFNQEQASEVVVYAETHNSVVGAPHLREEHYAIFDTASPEKIGGRFIAVAGHQLMMAAAQPFISGAISKTVNCPTATTVEEVEEIHTDSWRLGLKSNAIYRDGSKQTQPLSGSQDEELAGPPPTRRHKPPRSGSSKFIKLIIGEFDLYAHLDLYANGQPCAIFFEAGKKGSTLNGILDGLARDASVSLQHGTPILDIIKQWLNMDFEPKGALSPQNSDFTSCSSVLDLLARELALTFVDPETRFALGVKTREERKEEVSGVSVAPASVITSVETTTRAQKLAETSEESAPLCHVCGNRMRRAGSCFVCANDGTTTGCS